MPIDKENEIIAQLTDLFDIWAAKLAAGNLKEVIGEMQATAVVNRLRHGLAERQGAMDVVRSEARSEANSLRARMAEARALLVEDS